MASILGALPASPDPYATRLVEGVEEHRSEIDALLKARPAP